MARRVLALILLGVVLLVCAALAASESVTNRTGRIATAVTITFSDQVRITSYDSTIFPTKEPSSRAETFRFSGRQLENGARLTVSWTPSTAEVMSTEWEIASASTNRNLHNATAPVTASSARVTEDADSIYIRTELLELRFDRTDGHLINITDRKAGVSYISETDAWWSLFDLVYREAGQEQYIGGWVARSFSYSSILLPDGAALDMTWDGFSSAGRTLDIVVKVRVEVSGDPRFSRWMISVQNNENLVIEAVDFPTVSGLGHVGRAGSSNFLAYPSMSGILFEDPLESFLIGRGWGWGQMYPSAYAAMQFMAYYGTSPAGGLYLAVDDTAGYSKFLDFSRPDASWLHAKVRHVPEFAAGNDFEPPYSVIVGVFAGDWVDAAQIYRAWALNQPWSALGPLANRLDIPPWYLSAGVRQWIYTHPLCLPDANPFGIVPEVTEDTAANLGTPVLASWIGWERFGWYINYPDVFPPKEGWTAFTDAVEAVHQTGNRVLAIPDVTSLSDAASTWKVAEPNVCSDASGNPIEPWAYSECGKSATLFRMDPRASFWREAVLSLLNRLAELGVDALQLDGFPVFGPQACTAEVAGLPGGGGSWWTSCYYDLFDSFRATVRQTRPDLVLTSEGMAEFYIPLFDSFGDPFPTGFSPGPLEGTLVNDHTKAQLIPLWHVVYHDYMFLESGISFVGRTAPSGAVGYGSSRDYYMRGFGLALIWGEMPATWYADEKMSDLNEASEREAARYLQRVVQLRVGAGRPYLMYGSMQRMPTLDVPTFMIPETKSIPYTMADCPAFTSPAILCSLWRAADGDSAYVLTNISSESVNVSLTLDTEAADAAAGGTYSVATTRNNLAEGRLDNVLLPRKLRVDVAPLDVLLIEVQLAADGS